MNKVRLISTFLLILLFLLPACQDSSREVRNLVVLITDYGNESFYVGALKGAILSANPAVKIEDITHLVPEYDIREGAYLLLEASKEYPPGTVFVAVVDPGVGKERKCIALRTFQDKYYVGPDNGIFTLVIQEQGLKEIREITNQKLFRPGPLSHTFHGRDIFGPVGAYLASGVGLKKVGPRLKSWVTLPFERAQLKEGKIRGQAINIDHYGNVITNIPGRLVKQAGFSPGTVLTLKVHDEEISMPLVLTYGEVEEGKPLCLINAEERLEFALNRQNFARTFEIREGDRLEICK